MLNLNLATMKKSVSFGFIMIACIFPFFAQDENIEQTEIVPIEQITLKENQIPKTLVNSVTKDFSEGKPIEWQNFPFIFKKYGWVIEDTANYTLKPEYFYVLIKAKDGSKLNAVYSPDGKLIRSREILRTAPLPTEIAATLAKSEYKDWEVVGDKERITDYSANISRHYVIKIRKNKKTKVLYFDVKGNMLKNKRLM